MKPDLDSIRSSLNEEYLYSLARKGYRDCLEHNPHLSEELGLPLSEITLVEKYVEFQITRDWGATLEVNIDITFDSRSIGYYALIFEEDFTLRDEFFVIHP